MKVSIIIPIYNVHDYIINCLESVSQQTYQNIECILVDDCGKDDSVTLAKDYIRQYTGNIHFNIIHHNHNLGLSGARNTGIRAAKGDYIYFLDSDDCIIPNCIEILLNLAIKYPNADFIQGNLLGEKGKKSPYAFDTKIPEYCDKKERLEELMLHRIITSAWNRLIKRSLIIRNNLFFPEGLIHEDMFWVYFLSKYAEAAAFTTKGTYVYAIRDGSIMTSISKEMRIKRLNSRLIASDCYYNDIIKNRPSSHSRRAYFCINLFSCLQELILLKSFFYWSIFWRYVCRIALHNITRISTSRILFLFVLLPPFCFISRKEQIRWRIQRQIISRI